MKNTKFLTAKQKKRIVTAAKVRKAAKLRLLQKLRDGTWYNGLRKASGHALKQDIHDGSYTTTYSRFKLSK